MFGSPERFQNQPINYRRGFSHLIIEEETPMRILKISAVTAALLAGTALAVAQSSSTVGTGGSSAGGGTSNSTVGTGGSSAGGSGSGSASTLGTGGTSAGGGTSSSSVGTGGS